MTDEKEANRQWIEESWTRFEIALSEKDFALCEEIQAATGDAGFVNDALSMHHKINAAERLETYVWEPVEPEELLEILPEEMEAPSRMSFTRASEWEQEGDETFPRSTI